MDTIDRQQQDALARRIVEQYGDGALRTDKYMFDQMIRLTPGTSARRVKATEFVSAIPERDVIVLLDPHPNNRKFAGEVAEYCGHPDALAFRVPTMEIAKVLQFGDCDMCVLRRDGRLLAVATHEDSEEDGERMIWLPVANSSNA